MATPPIVTPQQLVAETVAPKPEVTINTPAAEIKTVNDNQPRNPDGTFATAPAPPVAPITPPPDAAFTRTDLGNGRFELKYQTGETFTGTLDELVAATANAHVNTKRWAQEKAQSVPAPVPIPAPAQSPEEIAAAQAREFIANETAKYLGFESAQQMKTAMGNIQQTTQDFTAQSMAATFMGVAPNFNPTPQNLDVLFKRLDSAGFNEKNVTVEAMRMAHNALLYEQVYQPRPLTTATSTTTLPPIAPIIPSSNPTAAQPNLDVNINMTAEQIKAKWDAAKAAGVQ